MFSPLGLPACAIAQARARITVRIRRLSLGNPGDVKPVGSGVSEMRIDYGLLAIGCTSSGAATPSFYCSAAATRRSQDRDIERALELAQED